MLKGLILAVALAWVGVSALALLTADRQIFFPPPPSYTTGDLPVQLIRSTDGVEIAVLHLRHPTAAHTILFSHGNAEDLGSAGAFLEQIRDHGFSVLAWDYRGYGASTGGRPTTRGAYADAEAVWRHATETLKIPPSRIILHANDLLWVAGASYWRALDDFRELLGEPR